MILISNQDKFVFRKQTKIGVLDARDDKKDLLENFVNTGDYNSVKEFDKPERFILGRTGSGKTALITKLLDDERHVISIDPESLSLVYVSNSNMIKELTKLGVNFDLFFRLLWRHVLAVEVLKYHFDITNAEIKANIVDRLKEKFSRLSKRNNHSKGLDYLDSYGGSFWQDTDYRIKEIVTNIEEKIEATAGAALAPAIAKVKAGETLSETQKVEITTRAQDVINRFQIKELADILKMIDDAIDDKQKKYYIVIDRLDENWVEDELRYRLIWALLETIKDFSVVERVKPMVVLRHDLINRVYDITKSPGFQEEKFSSLDLNISWSRVQLTNMLDQRIDSMIKRQYSGAALTHEDVMIPVINGQTTIEYMIDRTLLRPRDLIRFYNFCIEEANETAYIEESMILKAERTYSRDRRTAIRDEWAADYPNLNYWDSLLNSSDAEFFISDIDVTEVEKLCLLYDNDAMANGRFPRDLIYDQLLRLLNENIDQSTFIKFLLQAFYQVGYVGIKLPDYGDPIWSYEPRKMLHIEEIKDDSVFYVHKCFWSCFSVGSRTTKS